MIDIIIAISLLIIALLLALISASFIEDNNIFASFMPFGVIICTMIGIVIICYDDSPKAIDVYRGKTTLQITYQDSIPIDSVVVYKK